MPLKYSLSPNRLKTNRILSIRRAAVKIFKTQEKNGLSPRVKTISETNSEAAVVPLSSFFQKFDNYRQYL